MVNSVLINARPLLRCIPILAVQYVERLSRTVVNFITDKIILVRAYSFFFGKEASDVGEMLFQVDYGRIISVYCNDKATALRGLPNRLPGAVAWFDVAGEPIIIMNAKLIEMEPWFLQALVAHAAGHIHHHIRPTDKHPIRDFMSRSLSDQGELEADLFAAKYHEMLRTLHCMHYYGYNVKRRIAHLESKSQCGYHKSYMV